MKSEFFICPPYVEKEMAKELGCWRNPEQKMWYCIDSNYGKSNVDGCVLKVGIHQY
jgi:hypothetical protein